MRKGHHAARTVVLRLRFDDYGRATRSRTLAHPTTSGDLLAAAAVELLDAAAPLIRQRGGLTLVGVALTQLSQDVYLQGTLDFQPDRSGLDMALDAVAARFGTDSVTRGALLRTGAGWAMPVIDE
jgi:DNA polymerase-4